MNNQVNDNLLDELRPIIPPDYAIGAWPLAPGWWILCGLVLLLIAMFIFFRPLMQSRKQKKQLQKHTLQLLNTLYSDCFNEKNKPKSLQHYLQNSNDIFKRIVHMNPHLSASSHLTGKDWIDFILTIDPNSPFAKCYGDNLYAAQCNEKINLDELHQWAHSWIQKINDKGNMKK